MTRHDTARSSVLSFNLNKFFHLLLYSSRLPSTFIVSGLEPKLISGNSHNDDDDDCSPSATSRWMNMDSVCNHHQRVLLAVSRRTSSREEMALFVVLVPEWPLSMTLPTYNGNDDDYGEDVHTTSQRESRTPRQDFLASTRIIFPFTNSGRTNQQRPRVFACNFQKVPFRVACHR